MLDVDDARARVLDNIEISNTIAIPLEDSLGYVLAADVVAEEPIPRFDNSAMDGYAVRSEDVQGEVVLQVIGEVKAGDHPTMELRQGCTLKIMTGAVLPPGADAVIEVEETSERADKVTIRVPVAAGRNVRPAGDDVPAGTTVLHAGDEIGPGEAALLATVGQSRELVVTARPRVAVLVTGDEIVDPAESPAPGQIRDSNSTALQFLVQEAGGAVVMLERVSDTLDDHLTAFERAAENSDLIVSSGGVAVGDYDFVKDAVEQLGSIELWRVAMQPGKPVVLGEVNRSSPPTPVPFLGLPGNPVSVHVSFEQFVRPALRKMQGCRSLLRPTIVARLTDPIEKRPGRLHFVRVRLSRDGEGWLARPTGAQGSHVQTSLVGCHGLARFGKDETRLGAGAEVTVEVWQLPGS